MERSRLVRSLCGTQLDDCTAKGLASGKHAKRKEWVWNEKWSLAPVWQEASGRQQGKGRLRAHACIAFDQFDGPGNLAAKA